MTERRNKGKYEVCMRCGAHLDHGERCGCERREEGHDCKAGKENAGGEDTDAATQGGGSGTATGTAYSGI